MFTWTFSTHKEHSATWYIAALIVVLSLVVYGIVSGVYIMSVVAFLFAGVYILMENNMNPIVRTEVSQSGIKVGDSFYDYKSIKSFALVYSGDHPMFLRITPQKKLSTIIDIPLTQDVNPVELRGFLSNILDEDKKATITSADALIHRMKL